MIVQENENIKDTADQYILRIENFEGPLDLLWDLIKKSKIDIADVSISAITEQYISYLRLMENMNFKVAIEFIWMASELLFYKSRALLPTGNMDDEYFVPPLPPELVQKLLEYKKFQSASELLRSQFESAADTFQRDNKTHDQIVHEPDIEVSLFDLLKAFAEIIESSRVIEQEEIIFDEILVSDRIDHIIQLLKDSEVIHFIDIFDARPVRPVIVASFLAILEMTRTKIIKLVQTEIFGNIRIVRNFNLN